MLVSSAPLAVILSTRPGPALGRRVYGIAVSDPEALFKTERKIITRSLSCQIYKLHVKLKNNNNTTIMRTTKMIMSVITAVLAVVIQVVASNNVIY